MSRFAGIVALVTGRPAGPGQVRIAVRAAVSGAAGGVGSAVLQLVRHREIAVIGTASTQKHDYLRELGAIPTTYGPGLAERVRKLAPEGVNAALDLIFADVAQFCSAGLFRLRVEQTFPLEQAAKAQEVSAKGRVTGKLIISIA